AQSLSSRVATTAVVTCAAGGAAGALRASPDPQPDRAVALSKIEEKRSPVLVFIGFAPFQGVVRLVKLCRSLPMCYGALAEAASRVTIPFSYVAGYLPVSYMSTPKTKIHAGSPLPDESTACDAAACARDRIFEAARKLFYRLGIRGVSVDAIAAE